MPAPFNSKSKFKFIMLLVSVVLDPQEFILYERLLTPVVVVKDLLSNKNNSLMSTT